ncbi:hypothetical protein KAU43_00600 [candidate division WOR-3 bacterium]|nr:hypothetical protein [candidate division WOR-3 bacterium]
MFKKIIFAVIVVAIVATGCSLFDFGGGDLMPLTVGSYWNMKSTVIITPVDTTDTVTVDYLYSRSEITEKVTLGNGKEASAYKSGMTDSLYVFDTLYSGIEYLVKEDTAYFSYDSLSQATGDYQGPVKIDIGTIWNSGTMKFEVTAKEDVTVPAGTFKNAYKVAMITAANDTIWQWIAPGKGNVKQLLIIEGSTHKTEMTTELMAYEVK